MLVYPGRILYRESMDIIKIVLDELRYETEVDFPLVEESLKIYMDSADILDETNDISYEAYRYAITARSLLTPRIEVTTVVGEYLQPLKVRKYYCKLKRK